MWKISESTEKPATIDKASSAAVVYIRRNIVEIPATEETPLMYQYEENEVKKEDWETYESVMNHDTEIGEVQEALIELGNLIGG